MTFPATPAVDVVLVANDPDIGETRKLNSKTLGVGGRSIPFIEQIDVCWRSLLRNWRQEELPFQAWQLHTLPLGDRMSQMLQPHQKRGLKVLQVDPVDYHPKGPLYNRCTALLCDRLEAPVRLVIDADLIWLGTPPLDLQAPIAAMWDSWGGGQTRLADWGELHLAAGLDFDSQEFTAEFDYSPFLLYHLGDTRRTYPAMFNMGLVQYRRDMCLPLFDKLVPLLHRLYQRRPEERWMNTQHATSLAIRQTTDNWQILPPGVNFLPLYMSTGQALRRRVKIAAYHYASDFKGRGLEPMTYSRWFTPVPDYLTDTDLQQAAGGPERD